MKLGQLFPAAARGTHADQLITGITADSREVQPGNIFVAVAGSKADGNSFAADAIKKGAIAVIGEGDKPRELAAGTLFMRVGDARRVLSLTASALHPRQPSTIVAVTGTAGKTSVADFTRQIYAALGHQAASVGTIGIVTPRGAAYGSLTTPDPVALHTTFDRLAGAGITHLAMEASSHGLDQRRLDGVRLSAAAFTNLGRDHLDYHPTITDYLNAKLRLFDTLMRPGQPVVINADDDYAAQVVVTAFMRDLRIFSIGRTGMDLKLLASEPDHFSQLLTLEHGGKTHKVRLPLVGEFQATNALVAAGLAIVTGGQPDAVFAALEDLKGVRGRLDLVGAVHGAPVFVDYAHKPDALAHALDALRPFTKGKLVVVFGCGGDRDTGKRPIMGRIAAEKADRVFVTDDNPRGEDPAAIRAAILAAAPLAIEIGDRAEAIRRATLELRPGDCLIIAGKGHETGQITAGKTLPFSDHEVAIAAIADANAIPLPKPAKPSRKTSDKPAASNPKPLPSTLRPEADTNPPLWNAEALTALPGIRIEGRLPERIDGVSIDTRTLRQDDLFVAIKGDTLDGHDYVERAFAAGAGAAIVADTESARFKDKGALLIVPDTLRAMEALGIVGRARTQARIVAVTGSVGKTSTKEALLHVLTDQGRAHASAASYNNHWGVPLTLARMPAATEFGIFEIGMNHADEISPLVKMVRPHVSLITTVEPVHLANFKNVEGIADAKAEIFDGLEPGGVAILPRDNPHFERLLDRAKALDVARIVTFGAHPSADVRVVQMALKPELSSVQASIHGRPVTYKIGAPGKHMVFNSLGVLAAVEALGGDIALAGLSLARFMPASGRGSRSLLQLRTGSYTLLDESYNANPASVRAAIDLLGNAVIAEGGRRIAVLGDMLELGADAQAMHDDLAGPLDAAGIDLVFACGPLMKGLYERLPQRMQGAYAIHSEALEPLLLPRLKSGDVVMVKGSNGSKMGHIVKSLKAVHSELVVEPSPVD